MKKTILIAIVMLSATSVFAQKPCHYDRTKESNQDIENNPICATCHLRPGMKNVHDNIKNSFLDARTGACAECHKRWEGKSWGHKMADRSIKGE